MREELTLMLKDIPNSKTLLLCLFFASAIVGSRAVCALHYKRIGKDWKSAFLSLSNPIDDFNLLEWALLLFLLAILILIGFLVTLVG